MSRIGKKPVVIPSGVKVEKKDLELTVTGPKGTLKLPLHPKVIISVTDKEVTVDVAKKEDKQQRALWGLFRALVQNHTGTCAYRCSNRCHQLSTHLYRLFAISQACLTAAGDAGL